MTNPAPEQPSTLQRPWFLRGAFWQSVIGQALGTVLGGYLAVTIALSQQGLTEFTGWKFIGQIAAVVGIVLVGIAVLLIFAVGLRVFIEPIQKRLANRPWWRLAFEFAITLGPLGVAMIMVLLAGKWFAEQVMAW